MNICVVWQRKKASESVFVPTSLKNLMVTGVFGEKVRLREGTVMHVHHVHTCNYCWMLVFYTIIHVHVCMQSTHLMSRFPVNYAHNVGKPASVYMYMYISTNGN